MLYKGFISYSHAADARLAPALRSALRRIGQPWYRRAPFRIFLDESSLSANPALWDSIEAALAQSEYLLLLASTHSAQSEWVGRELNWWLSHRKPATILILLTDGEVAWRAADRDFDWERTTAIHPSLRGQLPDEPLWVDLRWARTERSFSLRHAQFRGAMLQIAPPLCGTSREDLDDEDARHYRSARRMAAVAVCVLAALVLGIAAAVRAARQEQRVADCRELAGHAIAYLDTRLDVALLLGVESSLRASCIEGRSALLTALEHRAHFEGFLSGHSGMVTSVAYAPGGGMVASSAWDRTVRLWEVAKRTAAGPILKGMYGLSFRPDGGMLASVDGDSLSLWRMPGGSPAGEVRFEKRYLMSRVAFSPDGRIVAASNDPTGQAPSEVFLFDASTRERLGATVPARLFAFSPDGKTLATEGEDRKSIVLRDIGTRRQAGLPLKGHTGRLRSIAFSVNGRMLAAGAEDDSVMVWDLHERRPEGKALIGHRAPVNSVAFSPVEAVLASGSGDGSVILWDLERFQPVGVPLSVSERPVFEVAFSPDGQTLVSNSEERVAVWNVHEGVPLGLAVAIPGDKSQGVALSPDGKTVASINTYGEITLSDAESGRTIRDSMGEKATAAAFSPDGRLLATVGWNGHLALWDAATGEGKDVDEATHFRLFGVAFSPDGATIAAGGDAVVLLWDIKTRQVRRIIQDQKDRIWSLAFSPDGKMLASGGNSSFGLWDARTGSAVVIPGKADATASYLLHTDVAFTRDGRLLAYRQGGSGVALWDIAHRRQVGGVLSGHRGTVTALAFSGDGRTMATGGSDGAVVLWDLATRQAIGRPLTGMDTEVDGLAFRPDSGTLVGLGEARVVVWNVRESGWRERACWMADRNLTREEWSRFFGLAAAYRETCPGFPTGK